MPKVSDYDKTWELLPYELKRDCLDLLAICINQSRSSLPLCGDQELTENQDAKLTAWVEKRLSGYPFGYITHSIEFCGCQLRLTQDVLIPRPETEILTHRALQKIAYKQSVSTILDLCCGSGCIGLAIKKQRPDIKVILSDLSNKACDLTKQNALDNSLHVDVRCGNFFEPIQLEKVDCIICNPPYLSQDEYDHLDDSVKNYEPKMALVSGSTGLEFYERLAKEASLHLNPEGMLIVEIGSTQGEDIKKIFSKDPWKILSLEKDFASLDRFFFIEIQDKSRVS